MNYDQTSIPDTYQKARDHGPAFMQMWMNIVGGRVNPDITHDVLDLGCGTGRFSEALATRFNAQLVGVDPSTKMIQQASNGRSRRVLYTNGLAEAIPLPADSVDLIFISMVFHHFTDPSAVAQECSRVLRNHGRLCLRTASSEQISMYPYVPFFPASRSLLEKRLPSLALQRAAFESAGFQTLSCEIVIQEVAADYFAYADKLAMKAASILAALEDADFDAGLQALRAQAATMAPRRVIEPIDLLVFAKPR